MSKKLIELDNGLLMEVDIPQSEIEMISSNSGVIDKVGGSIDTIKSLLLKTIQPISETYKELNKDMIVERAEVEIGIGFSAEGNLFIASGKGSANLKVKLVLSPKGE